MNQIRLWILGTTSASFLLASLYVISFGFQDQPTGDTPFSPGTGTTQQTQLLLSDVTFPDSSSYQKIVSGTVFSPTRRIEKKPPPPKPKPVQKEPEPAKVAPPPVPPPARTFQLKLIGVVEVNSEAKALVQLVNSDKIERLSLGMTLDGWELVRIDMETVTFKHKEQIRNLSIKNSLLKPPGKL